MSVAITAVSSIDIPSKPKQYFKRSDGIAYSDGKTRMCVIHTGYESYKADHRCSIYPSGGDKIIHYPIGYYLTTDVKEIERIHLWLVEFVKAFGISDIKSIRNEFYRLRGKTYYNTNTRKKRVCIKSKVLGRPTVTTTVFNSDRTVRGTVAKDGFYRFYDLK